MTTSIMSELIDKLASSLSKAQSQIENVSKDQQAYGYKYANLAQCLEALKKPLSDNGLAISQIITKGEDNKQDLVTILMHESGQWLKSTFAVESVQLKQGNTLQHMGAGITYARRYALSAIVGLTQEDYDGQAVTRSKQEVVEKVNESAAKAREFANLCKDNKLDVQNFAKFLGVDSSKIDSINNAIENFATLKDSYLEVLDANS